MELHPTLGCSSFASCTIVESATIELTINRIKSWMPQFTSSNLTISLNALCPSESTISLLSLTVLSSKLYELGFIDMHTFSTLFTITTTNAIKSNAKSNLII